MSAITSAANGLAAERKMNMHDHYTVFSTDGDEQQHTRLVIATDKVNAIKVHREHFPGCRVTGVIPNFWHK
jgi:hypothetical protein